MVRGFALAASKTVLNGGVGKMVGFAAFPPGHLAKLRALKRRYDPTGLFRDNFFIDPGATDDA